MNAAAWRRAKAEIGARPTNCWKESVMRPPALQCIPNRSIRRGGLASGRDRPARADGRLGPPALYGDRHPRRARSDGVGRAPPRRRRGVTPRRVRRGHRPRRRRGRVARSLLFEVHWLDPASMVAAALLLVTASALASYLPARRATSVDPAVVLRGLSRTPWLRWSSLLSTKRGLPPCYQLTRPRVVPGIQRAAYSGCEVR